MPSRRDFATVSGVVVTLSVVAALVFYLQGCAADSPASSSAATAPVQTSAADLDPTPPPPRTQQLQSTARAPAPSVPDASEVHRLATDSFLRLAAAIKQKDFAPLYQTMSPTFRQGVSLQRVSDEFRPFTQNAVDLTTANPKLLVVTPTPYFDAHGVLIVRGFQPTPVQAWYFEFGFLPEGQGWALISMSLSAELLSAGE